MQEKDAAVRSLPLHVLREANLARLPEFKNAQGAPAHTESDGSDLSLAEWANSVLGELGEAANVIKKIRRGDYALDDVVEHRVTGINERRTDITTAPVRVRDLLADELADVLIYLDILAFRAGIDLSYATIWKWNATSERIGCNLRIAEGGVGRLPAQSDDDDIPF